MNHHLSAAEARTATDWDRTLFGGPRYTRAFVLADRWASVELIARNACGKLAWSISWQPAPPDRLTGDVMKAFDAGVLKAKAEIMAFLAAGNAREGPQNGQVAAFTTTGVPT
jgi:hypothetical protein